MVVKTLSGFIWIASTLIPIEGAIVLLLLLLQFFFFFLLKQAISRHKVHAEHMVTAQVIIRLEPPGPLQLPFLDLTHLLLLELVSQHLKLLSLYAFLTVLVTQKVSFGLFKA